MNTIARSTRPIRPSLFYSIGMVLLAAIMLVGTTGTANSTPNNAVLDTLTTVELSDAFVQAAQTAELSDEEMTLLRDVMAEASDTRGDPAAMWHATTTAYENLRSDQRTALAEALQEVQGERGPAQGERRQAQRRQMRQQQGAADRPQRRQTRRDDDQRAREQQNSERFRGLGLTDEQQEELTSLREEYNEKIRALRPARGERPDEETRQEIQGLRAELRMAEREILTEEQRAQLEERRDPQGERRQAQRRQMRQQQDAADRPQRRQTRRGDRQPANIEAMAEALDLTTEQREMMHFHHALRAEVQRMRRNR